MSWKTIACRLTPPIPAAMATIAVKGPAAVDLVLATVQLKVGSLKIGRVHFGLIPLVPAVAHKPPKAQVFSDESEIAGAEPGISAAFASEQVVVCRTNSETVELHCHGGRAVIQAVLQLLAKQGCGIVDTADWPTRATCPLSSAAEQDLVLATTDKAAAVLLDQFNGALRNAVDHIGELIDERQSAEALAELERLCEWSELGRHLLQPWKVVFAGPPNVGKSSLMNAISGQLKSIVHHLPGTTRDWIEAEIALEGWPITLTDTAGIRYHDDDVEGEGVRRARQKVLTADLVALVIDAQLGWTDTHSAILELGVSHFIVVWNKADLGLEPPPELIAKYRVVPASTVESPGIELLLSHLRERLIPREPLHGQAIPFRPAHLTRLRAAADFLRQGNPQAAGIEIDLLRLEVNND